MLQRPYSLTTVPVIISNALEKMWQAIRRDNRKKNLFSDAEFLGLEKTITGDEFALHNRTAKQHPLYRSTVAKKPPRVNRLCASRPTPIANRRSPIENPTEQTKD
jgi:hypothetical protein